MGTANLFTDQKPSKGIYFMIINVRGNKDIREDSLPNLYHIANDIKENVYEFEKPKKYI